MNPRLVQCIPALPLHNSCVLQGINNSFYWPLLVVSWEGSNEKEALSAPLQKSSCYTKYSSELSLLSACFSSLKSAFPPANHFAFCRGEKPGEMTGLAIENKEKCQVWRGLETHASLNSALYWPQWGMKFLGNRSEDRYARKKKTNMLLHFSEKNIISLPAPPLEAAVDSWDKTVFSVLPSFPKLCLHSSSSAAVFMGSWELREVPSISFHLLTTFPAPLSPQTLSWAQCARAASGFMLTFHWLCKIHLRAQVFLTNVSYSLIPLLLLWEEEVLTG